MNQWVKRISAVVLVAVMMFGVVSVAAAQGPDDGRGNGRPLGVRPRVEAARELIQAVADATGLDLADIRAQLGDGKSLTEILQGQGIDPQTVIDGVKATLTGEINQAVTDGTISQARADALLARLDDALNRAMNLTRPTPIRERLQNRVEDSLLGVLAEMAGVDVGDLVKEAVTPPSLADIATAHGLDPNAVIAEAEARITADINQAVADGNLTQESADEILAGLHDRLVDRFRQPFRLLPGRGLRDGRPGGRGV